MKTTKSDYLKGVTAGLALRTKLSKPGKFGSLPRNDKYAVRAAVDKLERAYWEKLDSAGPAPADAPWGSEAHEAQPYIRAGYFAQGVNDAIEYGKALLFGVFRYDGTGHYNADKLADRTVYDDPSKACLRSWELDPAGHKYKGLALIYAHGAADALGLSDQVAA